MTKADMLKKLVSDIVWKSLKEVYNLPEGDPSEKQQALIDRVSVKVSELLADKTSAHELKELLNEQGQDQVSDPV